MPPFDAASVDGEHRFGRSLKTEQFTEQKRIRTHQSIPARLLSAGESVDKDVRNDSVSSYNQNRTSQSQSTYSHPSRNDRIPPSGPAYTQAGTAVAEYGHYPFGHTVSAPSTDHHSDADNFGERLQSFLSDQVTPVRLASHLAVLAVAAIVLIVSQVELPDWQVSLRSLPEDAILSGTSGENPVALTESNVADATEAFQRAVVPFTESTQQTAAAGQPVAEFANSTSAANTERTEITTYQVRSGDTVLGIAAKHGLNPETIQWANPELEANPDLLRVDDRLVILPVDGVLHVVQAGDTLSSIAAEYKVTPQSIAEYPLNNIDSINSPLSISMQLVVPGGTKPYIPRQVETYSGPKPETASRGTGSFGWPTSGVITQPFWNGHRAIDVGAHTGTSITAADSGYVISSRGGTWNNGYGNMVMIDHGNGYVTLYAHLTSIYVREGENVSKGEQIGTVGNTGNSTGPHLHFEVRYQGVPRNPFNFLP